MRLFFLLLYFVATCSNGAASGDEPDSCIGRFCLYKPETESAFVRQFGKGSVRSDIDDKDIHYRCFYAAQLSAWIEFQFGSHEAKSAEMVDIFVSRERLCPDTYTIRVPLNGHLKNGEVTLGMRESAFIEKNGRPPRVEILAAHPKNSIFDKRFGDRAYVYESDGSVLYSVVYIANGEVKSYRLSVVE